MSITTTLISIVTILASIEQVNTALDFGRQNLVICIKSRNNCVENLTIMGSFEFFLQILEKLLQCFGKINDILLPDP